MFFITQSRINPQAGDLSIYYRLVESFRDITGATRQRTILSVGFMDDVCPEELWSIADGMNARYEGELSLFSHSPKIQGLAIIANGIASKHGTRRYDKVNRRIERLCSKYPSVNRSYEISLEKDEKEICQSMSWKQIVPVMMDAQKRHGVYFIRTSLIGRDEELVWKIYNCIREIESSFRCLISDLGLRPIFHKTDEACEAYLHLGLLAYWVQ